MLKCTFEDGNSVSLRHIVVHAICERDGSLLLGKRTGNILESGKWGLIGGFLDRGETLEQGVLRELKEETGWEGKVLGLLAVNSNPHRPHEDRQNVAFDFIVEPVKLSGTPDAENSKVEWVAIDRLFPLEDFAFDHGLSIARYLKWRREKFPIPVLV